MNVHTQLNIAIVLILTVSLFAFLKTEDIDTGFGLFLFFGFLPIVNALFDWLSVSITRTLLKKSKSRGVWIGAIYGVFDFVLAVVCLMGLLLALVYMIWGLNGITQWFGGINFYDLDGFFRGVTCDPFNPRYLWVYAMFFSTMAPSLIHLLLALLSSFTKLRSPRRIDGYIRTLRKCPSSGNSIEIADIAGFMARHNLTAVVTAIFVLVGGSAVFIWLIVPAPTWFQSLLSLLIDLPATCPG